MEKFKEIEITSGKYSISNRGNVMNNETLKILKGSKNSSGYLQVNFYIDGKSVKKYIHRLVCEYFIGKSEKDVNHINHNKEDNELENLEYVTKKENSIKQHEFYGTIKNNYKTCKCGNTIWVTSKNCRECSLMLRRKVERPSKDVLKKLLIENTYVKVGKMYNVSDNTIRKWIK